MGGEEKYGEGSKEIKGKVKGKGGGEKKQPSLFVNLTSGNSFA
jgi:hypothetical protein